MFLFIENVNQIIHFIGEMIQFILIAFGKEIFKSVKISGKIMLPVFAAVVVLIQKQMTGRRRNWGSGGGRRN